MSQSNASSPPGQPEPPPSPREGKAGFFAAAGKRLKRVLSGSAQEPAQVTEPAPPESQVVAPQATSEGGEVETSVQARARQLVQHDRATRSQRAGTSATDDARASTPPPPPPPLPSLPRAADAAPEPPETAPRARKASVPPPLPKQRVAAPKRPGRDSKTAELRARLGAAKAQLADVQAKRGSASPATTTASSGDATSTTASGAKTGSNEDNPDPIRTLTIARLLAGQGYYDRSLSIYDELLAESPTDAELHAEAAEVRSRRTGPEEADSASQ